METPVVYVMAGEMLKDSGLQASQFLAPALQRRRRGQAVSVIAVLPLLSFLRDKWNRRGAFAAVQSLCSDEGIRLFWVSAPLTLGQPLSFLLHKPWLHLAAFFLERQMAAMLQEHRGTAMIFHCRSYLAMALALRLRRRIRRTLHAYLSFDMRSSLPMEFPLAAPVLGKLAYGAAVQWEMSLVEQADSAFLPLHVYRKHFCATTGLQIHYAPIAGFAREPDFSVDFAGRWQQRKMGFAGTFAAWNDRRVLEQILEAMPMMRPSLAMPDGGEVSGVSAKSYRYEEMPAYYDELLALVIPGRTDLGNYFVRAKMRENFFSTKASEALSRGVPLIVSSALEELASFVRANDCGLVYDARSKRFSFPADVNCDDRALWERLTRNALRAGESFTPEAVSDCYEDAWRASL
ncbi:MAG: hypothetical protein ACX93N_09490 [Pseudohaliea sp.]